MPSFNILRTLEWTWFERVLWIGRWRLANWLTEDFFWQCWYWVMRIILLSFFRLIPSVSSLPSHLVHLVHLVSLGRSYSRVIDAVYRDNEAFDFEIEIPIEAGWLTSQVVVLAVAQEGQGGQFETVAVSSGLAFSSPVCSYRQSGGAKVAVKLLGLPIGHVWHHYCH